MAGAKSDVPAAEGPEELIGPDDLIGNSLRPQCGPVQILYGAGHGMALGRRRVFAGARQEICRDIDACHRAVSQRAGADLGGKVDGEAA